MEEKTAVNTYLDPEDVEKLEELKSFYHVDKGATVIRMLIRKEHATVHAKANQNKKPVAV